MKAEELMERVEKLEAANAKQLHELGRLLQGQINENGICIEGIERYFKLGRYQERSSAGLMERVEALDDKLDRAEEAMQNAWGLAISACTNGIEAMNDRVKALEARDAIATMPVEGGTITIPDSTTLCDKCGHDIDTKTWDCPHCGR